MSRGFSANFSLKPFDINPGYFPQTEEHFFLHHFFFVKGGFTQTGNSLFCIEVPNTFLRVRNWNCALRLDNCEHRRQTRNIVRYSSRLNYVCFHNPEEKNWKFHNDGIRYGPFHRAAFHTYQLPYLHPAAAIPFLH